MIAIRHQLPIAMLASASLHAAVAWTMFGRRSDLRLEVARAAPQSIGAEGRTPTRVRLLSLNPTVSGSEPSSRAEEQPGSESKGMRLEDHRARETNGSRVRVASRLRSPQAAAIDRQSTPDFPILWETCTPGSADCPENQAATSPRTPDAAGGPSSKEGPTNFIPSPGGLEDGAQRSSAPARGTASPAAGGVDDAAWLAELHRRLKAAAQKCYPPTARRLRLRGEVSLLFSLNAQGEANRVRLARSSGSSILDQAATECVLRGALPAPGRPGEYGPLTIKFVEQP